MERKQARQTNPSSPLVELFSRGFGERSNRLENDLFLDAVAEFSDSGVNAGNKDGEKVAKDDPKIIQSFKDVGVAGKPAVDLHINWLAVVGSSWIKASPISAQVVEVLLLYFLY